MHHGVSVRYYSSGRPSGFIKTFVENLRKNLNKDKEMQENLKAFESEKSRIIQSDSVKLFRQKIGNMKV